MPIRSPRKRRPVATIAGGAHRLVLRDQSPKHPPNAAGAFQRLPTNNPGPDRPAGALLKRLSQIPRPRAPGGGSNRPDRPNQGCSTTTYFFAAFRSSRAKVLSNQRLAPLRALGPPRCLPSFVVPGQREVNRPMVEGFSAALEKRCILRPGVIYNDDRSRTGPM